MLLDMHAMHSSQSPQRYGQISISGAKILDTKQEDPQKRSRNCDRKMARDW